MGTEEGNDPIIKPLGKAEDFQQSGVGEGPRQVAVFLDAKLVLDALWYWLPLGTMLESRTH